jgi:acyl carrier protein
MNSYNIAITQGETMNQSHSLNLKSLLGLILDRGDLDVRPEQSLTLDLGCDSLQLMQFFAGVERQYPRVRLEEWFLGLCQEGQDTFGSLQAFIATRQFATEALAA